MNLQILNVRFSFLFQYYIILHWHIELLKSFIRKSLSNFTLYFKRSFLIIKNMLSIFKSLLKILKYFILALFTLSRDWSPSPNCIIDFGSSIFRLKKKKKLVHQEFESLPIEGIYWTFLRTLSPKSLGNFICLVLDAILLEAWAIGIWFKFVNTINALS